MCSCEIIMWIKICANTNLDDATLAAELGADALGFVFAPSPRRVTPDQVATITSRLPAGIEKIGVFYTLEFDEIAAAVRTAGLTGIQLHGGYSSELIDALAGEFPGMRLIQTTHWGVDGLRGGGSSGAEDAGATLTELRGNPQIDAVLADSRTATASGGTGVAFDWDAAREALAGLAPMRLIVAGGLNSGNVREAIAVLRPWGVDVASGVESRPGQKDRAKLTAFLANARVIEK